MSWTANDARELYQIADWGGGFFDVSDEGHAIVRPTRTQGDAIDLKVLVDELEARGIQLPILLRFSDILKQRLVEIHQCFARAIREYDYPSEYRGVYPIKVNEQRHVVESILEAGRPYHFGLEAGSKPELLTVLGHIDDPEALIICNGYKDEEFIELALLGRKVGLNVILVVEKFSELPLILKVAERLAVKPSIGLRVRLSSKGVGRWEDSGGDRSKFGLGSVGILQAVRLLREHDRLDSLDLLHFHLGSQICSVGPLRSALREASRVFVEIAKLGGELKYLDVGGGLAVDYEGTRSMNASSANYSVQEYANTVVWEVFSAFRDAGLTAPTLVSESGRALTAYHSVLVTNILGSTEVTSEPLEGISLEGAPAQLRELNYVYENLSADNFQESYHDVKHLRQQCLDMFNLGLLDLELRAQGEALYWASLRKIGEFSRAADSQPAEMDSLESELSDIYFLNMSVFQSLPDSWAIGQVFPIMPIHRLDEEPTREAVLADITCDSDGKINRFVSDDEPNATLRLHKLGDEKPYAIGIFLVGAYQEILGDLHNLFGDSNAVHISWDSDTHTYRIDHVEDGDTVTEVLAYVQQSRDTLVGNMRTKVELAVRNRQVTIDEARQIVDTYRAGFDGYTYIE